MQDKTPDTPPAPDLFANPKPKRKPKAIIPKTPDEWLTLLDLLRTVHANWKIVARYARENLPVDEQYYRATKYIHRCNAALAKYADKPTSR